MDKKPMMVLIAIFSVTLVAFLIMSGVAYAVVAAISSDIPSCEDAPYDPDCVCSADSRKIQVPWLGVPRWSCENIGKLLIDPESPTFEDDAIRFVEEYLRRNCGSTFLDTCGGVVCGCPENDPNCGAFASTHPIYPSNACISPVYGYGSQGARLVNVECLKIKTWYTPQGVMSHEDALVVFGYQPNADINPKSGTAPWRMNFFVESETETPTAMEVFMSSNYCYNEETGKKCAPQELCDYYIQKDGSADWCEGNLLMNFVPNDYPMAIFGVHTQLGSNWPSD